MLLRLRIEIRSTPAVTVTFCSPPKFSLVATRFPSLQNLLLPGYGLACATAPPASRSGAGISVWFCAKRTRDRPIDNPPYSPAQKTDPQLRLPRPRTILPHFPS